MSTPSESPEMVCKFMIGSGIGLGASAIAGSWLGVGALVGLTVSGVGALIGLPVALAALCAFKKNPKMAGQILAITLLVGAALIFITPAIAVPVVAALGLGTITYGKALLISFLGFVIGQIIRCAAQCLCACCICGIAATTSSSQQPLIRA